VIVAALTDELHIGPTLDGCREVSMTFRGSEYTVGDDPFGPAPDR
jgi:hypothetical protein